VIEEREAEDVEERALARARWPYDGKEPCVREGRRFEVDGELARERRQVLSSDREDLHDAPAWATASNS
jgi:hypothetical protein